MRLKVLASSSKGNSYILESPTGNLLLEQVSMEGDIAGLDYDISKVVGCLVSHEHKDHSKAILNVAKQE